MTKRQKAKKIERFMELEGIRGLAALAVVFYHFVLAFYPTLGHGDLSLQHHRFEDNLYGTPFTLGIAGLFAVFVFFVLSGFVLSIGFFQTKDDAIVKKMASNRYLRLMLPAFASIIIAFLLIHLGFGAVVDQAGAITKSDWLFGEWSFDVNIFNTISTAVVGIFVHPGTPFNNVLWTMQTEFVGSFMVFGFLIFFAKSRYRWLPYLILSLATLLIMKNLFASGQMFSLLLFPFVVGMAIADMYTLGWLRKLKKPFITIGLLLIATVFGTYPSDPVGTMYEYLPTPSFAGGEAMWRSYYLTIAAVCLILAVLTSRHLSGFLKHPRISVLGKYTFSLYLVHLSVIYTVGCGLFLLLQPIGYNKAAIIATLASLPVVVVAAVMFERYIDAPSIQFAKRMSAAYSGERPINLRRKVRGVMKPLRRFGVTTKSRELDMLNED